MNILNLTAQEITKNIKAKKTSAREVTQAYFDQAQKLNPVINAFISMNDKALDQADQIDKKIKNNEDVGPLAGVPIAIKDMLCTKGLRTTAGSKILHNFVPPYSATVVHRLEQAGAITLGKTNQDEFAMGSSNETSYFGNVKNPWNTQYVPGGSSGGSAAAVAARMSPVAIGTDTGGSIRQPSSFCGLVGIKPTYGRVSRYGIIAYASSLDQAGPMALTVQDAAQTLEVISGHCEYDSTTTQRATPRWSQDLTANVRGYKVGLPKEYFSSAVHPDVQKALEKVIAHLKSVGVEFIDVELPLTRVAVPIYYLVSTCEASSNLARYDGVRFGYRADFSKDLPEDIADFYSRNRGEGFGSEVKRRIMLGTFALSSGYYDAYYKKAGQVRQLLLQDFQNVFKKCDAILGPVFTSTAFKIGEKINDPLQMFMNDIFTVSANLAGLPGLSVPAGLSPQGLPIGVQLNAAHFEEQKILNLAAAIEQSFSLKEIPNVLR